MTTTFNPGHTFQPNDAVTQNNLIQSYGLTIETYVQGVLAQPTFAPLDNAPDLKDHQKLSKTNANTWITSVRDALYSTNNNLIAFNDQFSSIYTPLYGFAGDLSYENNRQMFLDGLTILLGLIKENEDAASNTVDTLSTWYQTLNSDSTNFTADIALVDAAYNGDNGELQGIKDQITACNTAISSDNSEMALGATAGVVGLVTIAVGVLAELPSGGASTVVVIAGMGMMAVGGTVIGVAAADHQKQEKLLASLTGQLALLTAEIAIVHTLDTTLNVLKTECSNATAAAKAMLSTWQIIGVQYGAAYTAFTNTQNNKCDPYAQSELHGSLLSWQHVADSATVIQNQLMGVPVTIDLTSSLKSLLSAPHVQLRVSPLRSFVSLGVKKMLMTTQSPGEVVQSLVEIISVLKTDVASFNNVMDATGLKQAVLEPARQVDFLIPQLEALGTTLSKELSYIIKQSPLNVTAVRSIFAQTVAALKKTQKYTSTLEVSTSALVQRASVAVASSSTKVSEITVNISSGSARIVELNTMISNLDAIINRNDTITSGVDLLFPILCPDASSLSDPISQRDAMLRAERVSELKKANSSADLGTAEAQLALLKSVFTSIVSFVTHANKLLIILQVLISSFAPVAEASSNEHLAVWIKAQASDLIAQLQLLVGLSTTKSNRVPRFRIDQLTKIPFHANLTVLTPLDCLSAITATSTDISACTGILSRQPTMTLDGVGAFGEQFQLARDHAIRWQIENVTDIYMILAHISAQSNCIVSVLNIVNDYLKVGQYDVAAKGITLIQTHVTNMRNTIKDQAHHLYTFSSLVQDDKSRFKILEQLVPKALNKDIAKLSEKISSLQDQIAEDNRKIAKGASDTIVKVLALEGAIVVSIAVSFIAIPVAAGASQIVVLAAKAMNASIDAASSAAKSAGQKLLLESIGGDDFLKESFQRLGDLRTSIIKLGAEQVALVIFNTVNTQVKQTELSVTALLKQLDTLDFALGLEASKFVKLSAAITGKTATTIEVTNIQQYWQQIISGANQCLSSYATLQI